MRNGTIKGKFVPVLCGSAFKNKGVQPLLDGVVDFLPSPIDVDVIVGIDPKDSEKKIEVKPSEKEKFVALAFKVMTDKFVGSLTFIRIYSGKLKSKSTVSNALKTKLKGLAECYLCMQITEKI